jgi:large repetitive protein
MNTSVQARRPAVRLMLSVLLMVALLPVSGLLNVRPAQAAYVKRLSTITTGAITFTGNTLGLSKQSAANAPGQFDAIGAFISTNTALRDGTYPFGTTADWHLNSSAANLNLPAGSTVLRAELIWSGSYSYGGENVGATLDTPVSLTTPGGATFQVTPDPATSNILGGPDGAGGCPTDPVPSPPATIPCFYVRSADVTARVQASGAYTVGGVPGTQGTADLYHNNAGWTLAVAYANPALPARSLTLFVGEEVTNAQNQPAVNIDGFCTPPNGALSGRLLVSATEGDANRVGDEMRFGAALPLPQIARLSGPNNLISNFFASQINNDTGALDTLGTFGTRNQNAAGTVNTNGGRQGWDITNVDISARLVNNQTNAMVQGFSAGDQYVINALGTQIDIQAPAFRPDTKTVDKAVTMLGDTLTYSVVVENIGSANADNVVFFDPVPAGTGFIANSLTVNGVAQPGADPGVGVNLGTVVPGLANAKTVSFKVTVNSIPPSFQFDNRARWTYDYQLCSGLGRLTGEVITNQVTTNVPALQPSKSVTPIGPVAAGTQLTYTINVPNNGTAATIGATLQDSIPAGTTYVAGSTTLNGAPVLDAPGNVMPFSITPPQLINRINSPGQGPGIIAPGAAAVVQFNVIVNPGVTASIENVAVIDQDGPGPIPPVTTTTSNPVVELASTKAAAIFTDTAPAGGSPGDTIEYTIQIVNSGSGPATGVSFNDNIPANSIYVPSSTTLNGAAVADVGGAMPYVGGQAINSPGAAAGTIAAGATATITFRVIVDNPLAPGVTQVVNQGTVTSNEVPPVRTDDPRTPTPGDPTITPLTSAPVLSADKAVALQIDTPPVGASPGDTLRYTVTIINSGNGAATGVSFNDNIPANSAYVPNSTTLNGAAVADVGGTMPYVGGQAINSPGAAPGTIPGAGGVATITFDVQVITPLPPGVKQVVNQGIVGSNELPTVPTNDPATPAPGDPTITPLIAQPKLEPFKQATLFVDADNNGVASPGDTILYEVTINNTGNAAASDVTYSDTPDSNTTLVAGSVQTSVGAITGGNTGTPPVTVFIGIIPGGASATISYKVTINSPLQGGVVQVVNQGIVNSNELPPAPTNDPTVPGGGPTTVPVVAAPVLAATKTDTLLIDTAPAGASPGDTLLYQVTIGNSGNTAATSVIFNDAPDSNTALVNGSVQTNLGTVTKGNTAGDTSLSVDIGTLPVGASVSISFRVTINTPLPAGVTQVANQGIVSAGNSPTVLTDDPTTPAPGDPTVTPISASPIINATKTVQLFTDLDGDGVTSPGDILLYTITIRNSGNSAATGVDLNDIPDSNTTLVAGSVQTSQGSVTRGNTAGDTSVGVNIGTIPGGGASVTISFRASINDPLPAGVTQVANQGIISGGNIPSGPTDDPTTPAPGDPTVTPITLSPRIIASKIDKLFVDADTNGVPSPGDTLLYQITIQNIGNGAATGMMFSDVPDSNTKLVVGSAQTSQGTITGGNTAGDTSVAVNIGTIPGGGATVTISFLVTINNPIQGGVVRIRNQGVVAGGIGPAVPTDDPSTPTPGDPTDTPITAAPVLTADKAVSLFTDLDNNNVPSPGDTLLYQVIIQNSGNTAATGVVFTDTPDANTTLVGGSVRTSQGTIGAPPVTVTIGVIPAGADVTISFLVTINNPLPLGVTQLVNQGIVNSNELPPVPTNDPSTPTHGDPTTTPVVAQPVLSADKTDILFIDTNHSGAPGAGDTLVYLITIANNGNVPATGVTFTDTPDVITTLVAGSVKTSQGSVTKGNSAGDTSIGVDIGVIPSGARITISFQVTINNPLPRPFISNQGTVTSNQLPPVPTNDPDTPDPGDPTVTIVPPNEATVVSLASFTAARQANGISVRWVTTAEINTWGFHLYRSADGSRTGAVRVTATIIPGQGRGQGGASYSWLDTDAQPGVAYSYWLQEVELNGTTYEYGPATAGSSPASQHSVFLAVAYR